MGDQGEGGWAGKPNIREGSVSAFRPGYPGMVSDPSVAILGFVCANANNYTDNLHYTTKIQIKPAIPGVLSVYDPSRRERGACPGQGRPADASAWPIAPEMWSVGTAGFGKAGLPGVFAGGCGHGSGSAVRFPLVLGLLVHRGLTSAQGIG